jgi:hypothetical protein
MDQLKGGSADIEDILNMMIFGIHDKSPSMQDIFTHNGAAWLGTSAKILKMEHLVHAIKNLDSDDAKQYFSTALGYCGIRTLPGDWRERVLIGSDRKQSATAGHAFVDESGDQ